MRRAILGVLLLVACSGDDAGDDLDASPPDAAAPDASVLPQTLAESGLYADPGSETLAPGVAGFQPAHALWSDGAAKRRWILIPEGASIDTSDMNFWSYPVGTKIWKEFSRDGTRVETRLIWKRGPGDWHYVAFAWDGAQSEAVAVPEGRADALGTDHDIPSRSDCEKCHLRQPDFVLGFSAVQLDHDLGGLSLDQLVQDGRLSDPPGGAAPYHPIPGDATAVAALGYLHANCGGCHHGRSDVMDETPMNLRLDVASMATVEETPVYQSAVDVPPEKSAGPGVTSLIEPGDPQASEVHARMSTRDPSDMMPPLATELVDDEGLAAVDAWITALGN